MLTSIRASASLSQGSALDCGAAISSSERLTPPNAPILSAFRRTERPVAALIRATIFSRAQSVRASVSTRPQMVGGSSTRPIGMSQCRRK